MPGARVSLGDTTSTASIPDRIACSRRCPLSACAVAPLPPPLALPPGPPPMSLPPPPLALAGPAALLALLRPALMRGSCRLSDLARSNPSLPEGADSARRRPAAAGAAAAGRRCWRRLPAPVHEGCC